MNRIKSMLSDILTLTDNGELVWERATDNQLIANLHEDMRLVTTKTRENSGGLIKIALGESGSTFFRFTLIDDNQDDPVRISLDSRLLPEYHEDMMNVFNSAQENADAPHESVAVLMRALTKLKPRLIEGHEIESD